MKICLLGDAVIRPELEARCTRQHVLSDFGDADLILDLRVDANTNALLIGAEILDPKFVQKSQKAVVYALCYALSAQDFAQQIHPSHPLVGFSLLAPGSDQSVIELARPLRTSKSALEEAETFFQSLGFEVLEVPDGPGLVAARLVACLANEAFSTVSEGVASAATIDAAMKLGMNYPFGPLEWAEHLGLDAVLAILEGLQAGYGEDRYRPHPLLRHLVHAKLGVAEYEAIRSRWS